MQRFDSFYIGGAWRPANGGDLLEVVESATEEAIATVPAGTAADIDAAVEAARHAFDDWSTTSPSDRRGLLLSLAEAIEAKQADLGLTIAREVGTPLAMAKAVQVGLPIKVLRSFANLLDNFAFEHEVDGGSLVVREPIGVVGAITPWNYPLHQIVAKVAAALAAGCTIVLKPSEVAPINAFRFAELVDQVGLPAGVFNLVTGRGPEAGEALAAHSDVDMVSFTGSTRAGTRVAEVAAPTVKRVSQELGGKSANLVLDDADLARAVRTGVNNCFFNSGQTCSAWTRMLVPRELHDEAADIARQVAARFTVGDPVTSPAKLGPLVSAAQRDRVRKYIQKGIDEGARLVAGGPEKPEGVDRGYFVKPTVFADVRPEMIIAREEIFGPVLSILPYGSEDEGVAMTNDSCYGLAGAVWSADHERAVRVARRLRTGQVDINRSHFNPLAPFGGYKQSGNGRELGRYGLEEFLETKSLQQ